MNKINKLQLIGEGEKEIIYYDDMSYELEGGTLKVYLTKQNQSKLLPLETNTLRKEKEFTNIQEVAEELFPKITVEEKLVIKENSEEIPPNNPYTVLANTNANRDV